MNWHQIETDRVLQELQTNPQTGLSAAEAQSRLDKFGYNELVEGVRRCKSCGNNSPPPWC